MTGSLSPVAFFILYNTPPLGAAGTPLAYRVTLLLHVGIIALAGIISNVRLLDMLTALVRDPRIARRVLGSWLVLNLFVGSQLSWILRPFIGSPNLPVEFLRPNAFEGNFYETVYLALRHVL